MAVNSNDVEQIVRQVLASMADGSVRSAAPAAAPVAGGVPKTGKVAVLTQLKHFDIREYPIPEVGDDDMLVKVEGCGVCGTDAHEYKNDPFGLIPVALGHEGTGEIVKMGKNVKKDSAGKDVKVGDKIVTCMIFKDNPDITMYDLNKQNVGGADVYGLLPEDASNFNGWFAEYILIRGALGSTFFNVSDLDLDSRILIEPCAVLIHAVERAKTTGILRFNSRVVVQGCGPIGLICIAILKTMGMVNVIAVDGNEQRLAFAKRLGAAGSVNFMNHKGIENLAKGVEDAFGGHPADFAFQCTGSPVAHANIYKFIRNGGGLCELGFFINGGDATINPHFDLCSKEITLVGSWVYTLRDYVTTFDFLKSGLIGAITPSTNPSETVICNAMGMIAGGNTVVFNPHPQALKTSMYAINLVNEASLEAGGPDNVACTVEKPTLATSDIMMHHPAIQLIAATGGPGVVTAVLSSGRRGIGAGAGNPPALIDETADIRKAAADVVNGCTFDNNLPCIAEKEIVAVESVVDELLHYMVNEQGCYLASKEEQDKLTATVLTPKGALNRKCVGRSAKALLSMIGVEVPDNIRCITFVGEKEHPLIAEELMMPILGIVPAKDFDDGVEKAVWLEHGNRHSAHIHSKNVDRITKYAKALDTAILVKNGPSYAALGFGGESICTFTIASRTGEGLTSAKSFTKKRRCVMTDNLCIR